MHEETNTSKRSRVNRHLEVQKYQMTKRIKIMMYLSFAMLFFIVGFAIMAIGFNYDGVTQKERVRMAKKDAKAVLEFGLTGQMTTPFSDDILPVSSENWQKEMTDSIRQAVETSEGVANDAAFSGKLYEKQAVMSALSNHYLTTLQHARDYKISKISFDKYHNVTVNYTVTPINLVIAQRRVQTFVNQELKKSPDEIANLSEAQFRLVEYALVASNWKKIVGQKVPTSSKKNGEIKLLYTNHFFKGGYQVTKETLNNVLNSGLAE